MPVVFYIGRDDDGIAGSQRNIFAADAISRFPGKLQRNFEGPLPVNRARLMRQQASRMGDLGIETEPGDIHAFPKIRQLLEKSIYL